MRLEIVQLYITILSKLSFWVYSMIICSNWIYILFKTAERFEVTFIGHLYQSFCMWIE